MKKPISVSNLTLDLYLDYVRPAAIAAGILEEVPARDDWHEYTALHTDAASADEIAHCMYCACMCAGNDGIERTHEEYIRHEAERMIGQLEVSIKYDLHNVADTLTALLAAMTEALHPTTPADEAPQAATEAPQADPITAAMINAITAPAPAHTVTVSWANGTRATYTAAMLDLLRTDPAALDIQDDSTGEMVYIKPDPAEVATQAAEAVTTDEQKEEANTMSTTTERYDYLEHMTADIIDAIRERYTDDEIRSRLDDDRDELAQDLNDDLWTDDSVTGNASGSYYCNAWRAEDAIAHNWDLIADMIDEFDAADILRKGPEAIDVSIRCYLLGQAIDAALDQLDNEIPEAEEPDEDDDTSA